MTWPRSERWEAKHEAGAAKHAKLKRHSAAAVALASTLGLCGSLPAQSFLDREIPPAECQPEDSRVRVLLLGSYHMSNPGADAFNLEADDVLAPKRQEEIRAVVDRLAEFRPTKVAVEAPWEDSATFARWDAYRAGERELGRSEKEQIGFRLAHQLGHETVYPIDVPSQMDFESVQEAAAADPRVAARLGGMQQVGEEVMAAMAEWLAEGTVGQMLYAGWYGRNLRIFANLTRIVDSDDDRVLLLFGQGHIPIVRDLVIDYPEFCAEDPLSYLEGT
ncbi:MAG: DUF5694 domain-containing protein [Gemmatimonadales bacterium]